MQMAKKKEVIIVDEELVPTTLYVKPDKKKTSIFSIIWVVIIFGIFIGGVIYLPEISAYVNSYLNPDVDSVIPSDKDNDKTDEEEKEEVKEYEIASNPEISNELIKINNLVIEDGKINFQITNLSEETLDLAKKDYFINLYDGNKKLIERIFLQDIVLASSSVNATYDLTDTPSIISLLEIKTSEYPAHVVSADENGVANMTCTKNYEKINYLLKDNLVYASIITYTVSVEDPLFSTLYGTYAALEATYNNYEGVTSKISMVDTNLVFETTINLEELKDNNLNLKTVYTKDTDAKIIYFRNTASGYTCD